MSLRPTIRHTQSSPGSSPSLTPSLAPSPPPLNSSHSSSHVSILVPDKPRSRPSSAALTPQEIHSALHHPGQPYAHGHSHSPVPGSVGMPRTSTQTSAGEGRYRKKVGFEAFEKGPATMFAFTCQVGGSSPSRPCHRIPQWPHDRYCCHHVECGMGGGTARAQSYLGGRG